MDTSFFVEVLGASGRAKRFKLCLLADSHLSLVHEQGEVLLSCARDRLLRWKIVDRRKLTTASSLCLDLQIQTNAGPQILRIRCLTETNFNQLHAFLKQEDKISQKQGVREELEYQEDARDLPVEVKRMTCNEVIETSNTNVAESKQKRKSQRRQPWSSTAKNSSVGGKISETSLEDKGHKEATASSSMLRSFGRKLRPTAPQKEETPIQSTPIEDTPDEDLTKNNANEGQLNWRLEESGAQLHEPSGDTFDKKEGLVNRNQDLRQELNQALVSLSKENPDENSFKSQLEILQGKFELLALENERLETKKHELNQSVAEMDSENEEHRGTIDALKEANEDVFAKFEDLRKELHITRNKLTKKEAEHEELEAKAKKLEAESVKWNSEREASKQSWDEIEATRNIERETLTVSERCLANLRLEHDELKTKHEQLIKSTEEDSHAKQEAQQALKESSLQVEHLAGLLARKESTLKGIEKAENERQELLREALEKAENAEHEASLAQKREQEKNRQLELLTQTLNDQRKEITNSLQTQWKSQLEDAQQQSNRLDKEVTRLKSEAMKSELTTQQLLHEKELLEKRVEQLTTNMTSSQICCSLTGINVTSVVELERVQQLEMDRQRAIDDLQNTRKEYENSKKESEISREHLKTEIKDLRLQIRDSFNEKNTLEADRIQLKHEVEALTTQLKTEKTNSAAMETRLLQENRAMEESFAKKLEKFNEKGGRTLERLQQELKEAETLITEKDKIQTKWKEETKKVARELEALANEQQRERSAAEKEISELKTEVDKANANSVELGKTLLLFKKQQNALRHQLSGTLQDNTILEQHLHRLHAKYTQLIEAYNETTTKVKGLEDVKFRLERERDSFGLRYETIRKQTQRQTVGE